jgi:hypothetical protein
MGISEGTTEKRDETLFQQVQKMTTVDKIRLAMRGDKEVRNLLIRDGERTVQMAVVSNPRITDNEIAVIVSSRNVHEEILRQIGASREWFKSYPVKVALVQNPKTPLSTALRLLPTLMLKDLRALAKSKSVPNVVAQAALRLLNKKE